MAEISQELLASDEKVEEKITCNPIDDLNDSKDPEDEGEINDNEVDEKVSNLKTEDPEVRKRKPDVTTEQDDGEPKSKKSALEKLKNMAFIKKDPFGNVSYVLNCIPPRVRS